ncbi:hypothetical protein ACQZV8_08425 [Magnetococcales bacterium HHB-1]
MKPSTVAFIADFSGGSTRSSGQVWIETMKLILTNGSKSVPPTLRGGRGLKL